MQVFISYNSKDRDKIMNLAADLEVMEHTVWWDKELQRTGGSLWWSNILENLRASDLFVFALSPHSLASDPCRRDMNTPRP